MYCPNCGAELPDWARFCERCGERIVRLAVKPTDGDARNDEASEGLGESVDQEYGQEPDPLALDAEPSSHTIAADTTAAYLEALAGGGRTTVSASAAHAVADEEAEAEPAVAAVEEAPLAEVAQPADEGTGDNEEADESLELPDAEATRTIEEAEGDVETVSEVTVEEIDEPVVATAVDQQGGLADVDDPSGVYDQFTMAPSPFVVLQQDEMSFYHDRADDGWEQSASGAQRFVPGGQRRMQEDIEHQAGPPMLIVAGVAVAIMVVVCALLFRVLGLSEPQDTSESTQIVGTAVSKDEGEEIIASLDGWWTTDRVLDGRFWHIEKKGVQTYAADGKLASENMLDVTKVERMATGPGGIDKPGYYLRDVGFYLADGEPDMLYALAADGSADPDANLLRTEEPTFQSAEEPEKPEESEPNESEYLLPDSATRVYDYTELDGMDDYDLFLARNEIVARHGCIFRQGGELEAYFTQKSWYKANEYYSDGDLTEIETQNLEVIRSVEYNHNSPYQWN